MRRTKRHFRTGKLWLFLTPFVAVHAVFVLFAMFYGEIPPDRLAETRDTLAGFLDYFLNRRA